jgi:hypothetical protein
MKLPKPGYQGHTDVTLRAAGVLRVYNPDLNTSPRVCARLYHPKGGDVAGLYTDRSEFRMVGKAGRNGKLMADAAGVELLKGKLPWANGPVELAPDTLFRALGMTYYPFSVLTHVLVCAYMPSDLLAAMVKAYRLDVMQKYGGLPVLGLPMHPGPDNGSIDATGLELVRWPEGVKLLTTTEELADLVSEQIFELEVDVLDL